MNHRSVVSYVGAVAVLAMAALLSGGTAAAQTGTSDCGGSNHCGPFEGVR